MINPTLIHRGTWESGLALIKQGFMKERFIIIDYWETNNN